MIRARAPAPHSPFADLPAIRRRLVGRGIMLVALDFDGTLTEIVDDFSAPMLTTQRRALLARIPSSDRRLAVVSGRALDDMRQRVGIPNAIVIGNHGLEIDGSGIRERPAPEVAERLDAVLGEIAARVEDGIRGTPGVVIENKRWTATLHIRPRDDDRSHAEVGRRVEAVARAHGFELRAGKATWEVRPTGAPDKGVAILHTIEHLPGAAARRTLYIGDDATDEDAFRALQDGVTIRVGDAGVATAARYRLSGPDEVYELLGSLFPREPE